MNERHLITLLVTLGILYFWNRGIKTASPSQAISSSSVSSASPCDNLSASATATSDPQLFVGTDENAAMFQNLAGINSEL